MNSKEYRKKLVTEKAGALTQVKAHIQSLKAKFGLTFPNLIYPTNDLRRGNFFAGKVTLRNGEVHDPCLIKLFSSEAELEKEYLLKWVDKNLIHVAGEVEEITSSDYTVPSKIFNKAGRLTSEYRMGSWMPLLVSIHGDAKYILPAFSSLFFEPESGYKGIDLDPDFCVLPDKNQQKKGAYSWSFQDIDFTKCFVVGLSKNTPKK